MKYTVIYTEILQRSKVQISELIIAQMVVRRLVLPVVEISGI